MAGSILLMLLHSTNELSESSTGVTVARVQAFKPWLEKTVFRIPMNSEEIFVSGS